MSIFDVDYSNTLWRLLVPPDKRLPKWLKWGMAVMTGKQWKHDAFFTGYKTGAVNLRPAPHLHYLPAGSYVIGDVPTTQFRFFKNDY